MATLPVIGSVVGSLACIQTYTLIRHLGHGASGITYQAQGSNDHAMYALKLFVSGTLDPDELQSNFDGEVNR